MMDTNSFQVKHEIHMIRDQINYEKDQLKDRLRVYERLEKKLDAIEQPRKPRKFLSFLSL